MKKIIFRTVNDEFISEVEFDDFDKLFVPSDNVYDVPEIPYPRVFDELIGAIDVLIPYNDGEDFIFIKAGDSICKFADDSPSEDIIGRRYGEIFPSLFKSKHFDRYRKAFLENYLEKCNIEVYEDDVLIHTYLINAINDQGFLFFYSQNFTDYNLIDKREKLLFNESAQGIIFYKKDGTFCRINDSFIKMTGYDFESLNDLGIYNFLDSLINKEGDLSSSIENISKIFNHEKLFSNSELSLISKSGEIKWFITHSLLTEFNGDPVVQTSFLDITNRKNAEIKALNLTEDLAKIQGINKIAISHKQGDGSFIWTSEIYNILEISEKDYNSSADLIDKFILFEDKEYRLNKINNLSKDNSAYNIIVRVKTIKGNLKYLASYNKRYYENDEVYDVGFIQDITGGMIREKELESNVYNKKILLQEVHHRVKNNLQILLSMINLELRFNENNIKDTLEQTRNRINSMSLIHEKIYQSSDIEHVNIKNYMESEINSLRDMYGMENISLNLNIDDIEVDLDISISLGLILNELIINSIKYAFPNGQSGIISISFKLDENILKLTYGDDGVGLPENLDIYNSPSFGLTIINSLVNQLNGKFTYDDNVEGSFFNFNFKIND